MEAFQKIRDHFRPIQPAVHSNTEGIHYLEIEPPVELRNYVFCFWQLHTPEKLEASFTYRVVSDGCIDIFFDHRNPPDNFVMGFCRKFTQFSIGHDFDYIGIRFLPSAFTLLFDISAKKLSNRYQPLVHILPQVARWISEMDSALTLPVISGRLSELLLKCLDNKQIKYDARFFESLDVIFKRKGNLDVEIDLNTGISPRQLRRLFNFYVGTTPKGFSSVVRFQYILNAKPSRQSLRKQKIYLQAGYFDQAHFIKDFKRFYGVTPREALQ